MNVYLLWYVSQSRVSKLAIALAQYFDSNRLSAPLSLACCMNAPSYSSVGSPVQVKLELFNVFLLLSAESCTSFSFSFVSLLKTRSSPKIYSKAQKHT